MQRLSKIATIMGIMIAVGCGSSTDKMPKKSEVVGKWIQTIPSGNPNGEGVGVVDIKADGTFVAEHLTGVLLGNAQLKEVSSGNWDYLEDGGRGGVLELRIRSEKVEFIIGGALHLDGHRNLSLRFEKGDPDNQEATVFMWSKSSNPQ
jgi:hypothetical protein